MNKSMAKSYLGTGQSEQRVLLKLHAGESFALVGDIALINRVATVYLYYSVFLIQLACPFSIFGEEMRKIG